MEIKAELKQPYTEDERVDFIVKQNHELGYEIREVECAWQEEIQVPCLKTVTEIIQEPVLDDDGKPFLDDDGNPIYKSVEVTREVQETETIVEIVKQPKYDEEGNPVLDENGEQMLEDVEVEKEIPKYRTESVTHTGYNLQAWGYTEEELAQQKQEQISQLSMTRGDVFEALILAKGLGKAQIRSMIEQAELDTVTKALYLNRFDEALEFYRGYPIFDMLGQALGITSEMLDKFFKTKDYHYLTTCKLIINPTPAEATVVINSEVVNEVTVPYGSVVDYIVSCDGYESKADVFEITKDEFLEVVLDEDTTDTTESDISI